MVIIILFVPCDEEIDSVSHVPYRHDPGLAIGDLTSAATGGFAVATYGTVADARTFSRSWWWIRWTLGHPGSGQFPIGPPGKKARMKTARGRESFFAFGTISRWPRFLSTKRR